MGGWWIAGMVDCWDGGNGGMVGMVDGKGMVDGGNGGWWMVP